MADVSRIPNVTSSEAARRLHRLRRLAWWLDRSFGVGPKGRFGLDPLLGLIPGVGDWAAAVLSLYIVYEATRLGLSWSVIGRMTANIAIEAVVGAVPIAGDAFDFFWQANTRNLRLVERHYHPRLPARSLRAVVFFIGVLALFLLATLAAAIALAAWAITALIQLIGV